MKQGNHVLSMESESEARIVSLALTGKLDKTDYEAFMPKIEEQIKQRGKIRLLVELIDFHGWKFSGLIEDTKFGFRHFNDIDRLAIVGDRKWEKGMATFCKPFTTASIRYFEHEELEDAKTWLHEDLDT